MKRAGETLDQYMSNYTDFNDWLIRRRYELLKKYFQGSTCLEMGSAHGEGTGYLVNYFEKVVAVDGSQEAIGRLKERYPTDKLEAIQSYFEDLYLDEKFDTVVLAHILEHVDNPQAVLAQAKRFVKPEGVIIIDVPNGNSLHRQVGVKMGLLEEKTELNDADLSIGHQRVYTPNSFQQEINDADLKIVNYGGMFIKILSNAQTQEVLSGEQLEALFLVGEENPDIAAEIFIVAQQNTRRKK